MLVQLQEYRDNLYPLFSETIDGYMLSVPINDKESIAEFTSLKSKGFYLFTQMGTCVSISDDIMVSQQHDLYNMMIDIINNADHVYNNDGTNCADITGTSNIMRTMVDNWGLTEGQTMGSLSVYKATETDNTRLQVQLKEENNRLYYAINLYVDETAYKIYNGSSYEQPYNGPTTMDNFLYEYRKYEGLSTEDESASPYLNAVIKCFMDVSAGLVKE